MTRRLRRTFFLSLAMTLAFAFFGAQPAAAETCTVDLRGVDSQGYAVLQCVFADGSALWISMNVQGRYITFWNTGAQQVGIPTDRERRGGGTPDRFWMLVDRLWAAANSDARNIGGLPGTIR